MARSVLPLSAMAFMAFAACSDSVTTRPVGNIRLLPDTADIAPGEVSVHRIRVIDERGEAMGAEWPPRVEWTFPDTALADVEIVGDELRVTARAKGSVRLYARLGSIERQFRVWVHPLGLARIDIDPNPVIIGTDGVQIVEARLLDAEGRELNRNDFRVSGRVADTTLASLTTAWRVIGSQEERPGTTQLIVLASGTSAAAEVVVTLEPTPSIRPPTVVATSEGEVALAWPVSFSARMGYEVERAPASEGPWAHLAFTGPKGFAPWFDTTYVDSGLAPATTSYYRFRPCNTHGCAIAPSPVAEGTTSGGGD